MVLSPPNRYDMGTSSPFKTNLHDLEARTMQNTTLDLIADAMIAAFDGWLSVYNHTDRLLNSGGELFEPDLSDRLLFDDESFTGSRKYFWLINSLHTIDFMISRNIETWVTFEALFVKPALGSEEWTEDQKQTLRADVANVVEKLTKIVHVQEQFENQRKKTVAIRDAASSLLWSLTFTNS